MKAGTKVVMTQDGERSNVGVVVGPAQAWRGKDGVLHTPVEVLWPEPVSINGRTPTATTIEGPHNLTVIR